MNAILLQAVFIIDTVLVTPLGEEALAAMGLAGAVGGIVTGVLFALSNGTQLVIAQAFGAASNTALKSGFWAGLVINLTAALAVIAVLILFSGALIGALSESADIARQAREYLAVFLIAVTGLAVCQNITVFFNAQKLSKAPFFASLAELPVNAAASVCFIYGYFGMPEMGVAGAALGTCLAAAFRAIFLTGCLYYFQTGCLLSSGWSTPTFTGSLKNHFSEVLPVAVTFISMTVSAQVCQIMYAKLGVFQFAALTLLTPWLAAGGRLVNAWCQAAGILTGQMLGGRAFHLLDGFVSRAWRAALVLGLIVSLLYMALPPSLSRLYEELQEPTVAALWSLMPVLFVMPLVRTSNTVCGHVLRAGGDAAYVLRIHVSAQWLFTVPATAAGVFFLNFNVLEVYGLLIAEEMIKAAPFHLRMRSGAWKRIIVQGAGPDNLN